MLDYSYFNINFENMKSQFELQTQYFIWSGCFMYQNPLKVSAKHTYNCILALTFTNYCIVIILIHLEVFDRAHKNSFNIKVAARCSEFGS